MSDTPKSVTWRDVNRIREAHPNWGPASIARELRREGFDCQDPYVRATFQRRGWTNPNGKTRKAKRHVATGAERKTYVRVATVSASGPGAVNVAAEALNALSGNAEIPWWNRD